LRATLPASALLCGALLATTGGCAGRARVAPPPLFPLVTDWSTPPLEGASVGSPASDGRRVFVATDDGTLRALEMANGATAWRVQRRSGLLAAGAGIVVVRETDGTIWNVDPADGSARWKVASGIAGEVPPVLDGDRILVAGDGLAVLEAASGKALWSLPGEPKVAAPPLVQGPLIFLAEADGTLRARDGATGSARWQRPMGGPLWASPAGDDRRLYVPTSARRLQAVRVRDGEPEWRWKVGTDIRFPPLLAGGAVLFASHEAVLYALKQGGGSMLWRATLTSRPLSGPMLLPGGVLVACHGNRPSENFLAGFDLQTGRRLGDLQTPGELQAPPILAAGRVVMALRNRSVVALVPGGGP
jgi:outer membrane protein assembly factor BamB